jgi:YHS domain-containing protein
MKLITTSMLGLTLALGAAAVFAGDGKDAEKSADKAPTTKPINQFCAVEQENKIDPKGGTYVYKDKVIGFCCPDCIDEFKKDPEKYMAKIK